MWKLTICLVLLAVVPLKAQVAAPVSRIAWDQSAPDLATASAYTYRVYADAATVGVVLTGVTCSGATAPFVCSAPFPAFTPGPHTLTLTSANIAGESAKSATLSFTFVVIPAVPANLRIQ